MLSIPIVIITYDRPASLKRLLNSLLRAKYQGDVKLIISIDGGGTEQLIKVAENFEWKYGEKEIIKRNNNLGLKKHILTCGGLAAEYDGVILLEDDLYVSPDFYQYVLQANEFYKDDERVGGISLYAHLYNETAQFPFTPISDGSDVFFMQYASSCGQFWSQKQWKSFKAWYDQNLGEKLSKNVMLPPNVLLWPESSWKKFFIKFLILHDKYFVFPRVSLTTNFNEPGAHIKLRERFFQVPLHFNKTEFNFIPFDESYAVYDVHCEILASKLKLLSGHFMDKDFEVDLYGMKIIKDITKPYILTSRSIENPEMTFGKEMKPHEVNIIENISGSDIYFGETMKCKDYNYMRKLLRCHEKEELTYFYPMRTYHFSGDKILATDSNTGSKPGAGFLIKKVLSMFSYAFKYFFRKGSRD